MPTRVVHNYKSSMDFVNCSIKISRNFNEQRLHSSGNRWGFDTWTNNQKERDKVLKNKKGGAKRICTMKEEA